MGFWTLRRCGDLILKTYSFSYLITWNLYISSIPYSSVWIIRSLIKNTFVFSYINPDLRTHHPTTYAAYHLSCREYSIHTMILFLYVITQIFTQLDLFSSTFYISSFYFISGYAGRNTDSCRHMAWPTG